MDDKDYLVSRFDRLEDKMDQTQQDITIIRERVTKVETRSGIIASIIAALVSGLAALMAKFGLN